MTDFLNKVFCRLKLKNFAIKLTNQHFYPKNGNHKADFFQNNDIMYG